MVGVSTVVVRWTFVRHGWFSLVFPEVFVRIGGVLVIVLPPWLLFVGVVRGGLCDWGLCVRGLGGLVSTCGYVYLCNISKFIYCYGGRVGCRGLFCSFA